MKILITIMFLGTCWLLPAWADWRPDPSDPLQVKAGETLERFRDRRGDTLQGYLDEAYGFAIYPRLARVGLLVGGSFGRGVLIEAGQFVGYTRQWRANVGAQLGAQSLEQIIFFRDRESFEAFREGKLTFLGEASVALATMGAAGDPGYSPDVAIFSLVRRGLMLEAAAGPVWFRPVR